MKLNKLINLLIVIELLFVSSKVDAQIDTAHVQYTHINQYIYPHLMDPNYTSVATFYCAELDAAGYGMFVSEEVGTWSGLAQRYEVRDDSVKIMGAALMLSALADYVPWETHQITISIWDSTMTTEIYTQTFVDGSCGESFQGPPNSYFPFLEFIFDDTITLYEDYHLAVVYEKNCLQIGTSVPMFMALSDYACEHPYHGCCTPYGISTKYKPYVRFGCDNRDWRHVDSVDNWMSPTSSYHYAARYQRDQVIVSDPNHPFNDPNSDAYDPNIVLCDTVVYKAFGLLPIRALTDNDSTLTGDDSTSTGGGSTSTDDDSISTGGGDSYIATVLADEDIELYPNPADEVLNIRSDYNITEIEVIDAINRVIERWELNTRELTLDVASYKSGTYFIIIKTDKGSLTKKFIVR